MDERRIKEAEENVRDYLQNGMLKKTSFSREVFDVYMKNSSESVKIAEMIINSKESNLWVVVVSYYSMYYIANALLLKLGYKVDRKISHKVTADAMIVFARKKINSVLLDDLQDAMKEAAELASIKTDEMLKEFEYERDKRSKFQYEMPEQAKERHAKTSFERAKRFHFELLKLLK